jgi:hypothetical protein
MSRIPLYYTKSINVQYLRLRFIHSLLTTKHARIPDLDQPKSSAEYRAFEQILRYAAVVQYDLTTRPLEIAQEMCASSLFDVIVPRPAQSQVKKQLHQQDGQTAALPDFQRLGIL